MFRLRELGFSEGDNTVIERRFADGRNERYVDFAFSTSVYDMKPATSLARCVQDVFDLSL